MAVAGYKYKTSKNYESAFPEELKKSEERRKSSLGVPSAIKDLSIEPSKKLKAGEFKARLSSKKLIETEKWD